MKIESKSELSSYIFGALDIFESDGWIGFSRFTEKQGIWLENNGFPRDRYSTSGMRLEFITNGGVLSFDYRATQSTNGNCKIFGLEIVADGIPVYHLYDEELPLTNTISYEIKHSQKPVHIVVYFPLRASLMINNLNIPDDAQIVKKKIKILTYGDSITAGAVCRHSNHSYVNLLADEFCAQLINQGVGGLCYSKDFLDKLSYEPDIVTIAYGVNDYNAGRLFGENPKQFLEKISDMYNNKKVFVLLPIWYGGETKAKKDNTLDDGRKYLQDIANKYAFNVVDCKNFVPHLSEFYWDDENLHPNDLGFLYYGHNLSKRIKEFLHM